MIRQIIHIDEDKCNGCGLCANACHEGAIEIVEGKAKLVRENFCDGFGDCLPGCPTGAITFESREAPAYDESAVKAAKIAKTQASRLRNWPVQIKLAPLKAPYFEKSRLLIAADCTAFAYATFHKDFAKGRCVLVGCPKLDGVDYSEKLALIIANNDIQDILVVRMEVPCCGGLTMAVDKAVQASAKDLAVKVVTISAEGRVL